MITTINKVNKGLYNQLFADVQEWLYTHNIQGEQVPRLDIPEGYDNDPANADTTNRPLLWYKLNDDLTLARDANDKPIPETISSLDELFVFMDYLTDDLVFPNQDYSREQDHAWIYTRLPLDEEPFYIDANARTISVPSNFAKNGISVQGDEVAEILFFKINRFFDATDLATCQIYVQWQTSPAEKDAEGKSGMSRPWIVDITSEPGYLIFGWPITSTITEKAGDITFSVRFYREYPQSVSREVAYSFSTLDQKVTIRPALDYDIQNVHESNDNNIIVDDASTLISLRAVNSPDTSSSVQAATPVWSSELNNGRVHDTENGIYSINNLLGLTHNLDELGHNKVQLFYLGEDENGFRTQPIFVHIQAVSDDSGVVTYKWTKADITENGTLQPAGEVPEDYNNRFYKAVDYIETQDSARTLSTKTYYYKTAAGAMKVLPLDINFVDGVAEEPYGQVYDQVSTAILDEIGDYRAIAINRVGRASAQIEADPIRVPGPVAPVLDNFKTADGNAIMSAEHNVVLTFDNIELKDDMGYGAEDTGAKATFKWQHKPLNPEDAENITDKTTNTSIANELRVTVATENETPEGYYRVTVYNNLNGRMQDDAVSTTSDWIRVTKQAVVPYVTLYNDVDMRLSEARETGIKVNVANLEPFREESDGVTYQWYFYTTEPGANANADAEASRTYNVETGRYGYELNNDIKIEESARNNNAFAIPLNEAAINSAITDTFLPNSAGFYFCVVTNHYNGSETSVLSPFYNVQNA